MPAAGFSVSKKRLEDVGELNADGELKCEYRWDELTFDFGDRQYWARIYVESSHEAGVFGPLRREEPRSRADLEEVALYLKSTEGVTLVTLLNPLEADGYLSRNRDPVDRRRHVVTLSPAGERQLDRAAQGQRDAEDELFASLTDNQREELRALLLTLRDNTQSSESGWARVREGQKSISTV